MVIIISFISKKIYVKMIEDISYGARIKERGDVTYMSEITPHPA